MASTRNWFESVTEAERRARRRLPRSVYRALIAGSERGDSARDNVDAFRELGFIPRVATGLPQHRDLATSVMGHSIAMPVMITPAAYQAVHPAAEVAVAQAAAQAGIAMGLSSFASKPLREVTAANPMTFFQMYWTGGRQRMAEVLGRVRTQGAAGIILTLDWSFAHRWDLGSPTIPESLNFRTRLKLAPEVAVRPRWLLNFCRAGGLPTLTVPNMQAGSAPVPGFFATYQEWMATPQPTWDDVAWMRAQWDGPFMVKGVAHPDDARHAVEAGATTISVSNHGGSNLDGTPASIRLLPAVVQAVGNNVEVVLDGGIRRGSDVVKAVALGARAVMIGRAPLWGLAATGRRGVENVLEILRAGIDETLLGIGSSSIHHLGVDDIVMPDGFDRAPHPSSLRRGTRSPLAPIEPR